MAKMLYTENFAFKLKDFKSITIHKHDLKLNSGEFVKPCMVVHTSYNSVASYSLRHQTQLMMDLEDNGLFTERISRNFATELIKHWRNYCLASNDEETKKEIDILLTPSKEEI